MLERNKNNIWFTSKEIEKIADALDALGLSNLSVEKDSILDAFNYDNMNSKFNNTNATKLETVMDSYILSSTLSKYNNSKDPNIQTFLAGIYRKTKIPDAFGPLCAMLIQNAINPPQNSHFDPNEEIGGAILDYLA